ncbi:MAG: hypothetical protein ACRCZS_16240 [Chroococcidiopsis sp.]
MKQFTEAEQQIHLANLAKAYAETLFYGDNYGFGAWGGDQYRPFGNSCGIHIDILEACDIDWTEGDDSIDECPDEYQEYAEFLYKQKLGTFLKEAIATFSDAIVRGIDE